MSTTVTLQVTTFRFSWKGREFKLGDIIRYHSHFGYWRSDFHTKAEPQIISQTALDYVKTCGWTEEVSYCDWWSAGTIEK